jgi:hypothetical protein
MKSLSRHKDQTCHRSLERANSSAVRRHLAAEWDTLYSQVEESIATVSLLQLIIVSYVAQRDSDHFLPHAAADSGPTGGLKPAADEHLPRRGQRGRLRSCSRRFSSSLSRPSICSQTHGMQWKCLVRARKRRYGNACNRIAASWPWESCCVCICLQIWADSTPHFLPFSKGDSQRSFDFIVRERRKAEFQRTDRKTRNIFGNNLAAARLLILSECQVVHLTFFLHRPVDLAWGG